MFERVLKTRLLNMAFGSFGGMYRWLLQKLNHEKQLMRIIAFLQSQGTMKCSESKASITIYYNW